VKKYARPIMFILIAGSAGLAAETYLRYRRDLGSARKRIGAGSELVDTPCGRIEYAVRGEGAPVLVVHGAGGGYDQGLLIGESLLGDGFHIIAPSRFGYLRTPLPDDAAAEAQADAHACLLDALEIPRAAVVGVSAGAPSSVQFALRHPQRCTSLTLISGAMYAPEAHVMPESPAPGWMLNAVLRWDFPTWLAGKLAPRRMLYLLGVPRALHHRLPPETKARLSKMMDSLLPISARRAGLFNDAAVVGSLDRYPLEQITAPTLVVNAADDPYDTFAAGEFTAENIPGAEFVALESGGHLLLGHEERIRGEVSAFIREHAAV
jgi:2-hydroxy-6-oxonona-2,4-dienedioate hydrolase